LPSRQCRLGDTGTRQKAVRIGLILGAFVMWALAITMLV
jgi:hypothetical protein